MADRYEAVAVRRYKDNQGNDKAAYTNIGIAWPMKDRDGYTLRLNAMPAPQEGEFVILLMPPKPKDDRGQPARSASRGGPSQSFSNDMDDDIPFAMEWRI